MQENADQNNSEYWHFSRSVLQSAVPNPWWKVIIVEELERSVNKFNVTYTPATPFSFWRFFKRVIIFAACKVIDILFLIGLLLRINSFKV